MMERISSWMTTSRSKTIRMTSYAIFISSGERSFPMSSRLVSSSPSSDCFDGLLEDPSATSAESEEYNFSSFISRSTSFIEMTTCIITRPIAVMFVEGVIFIVEHAS
ncbi:hypothetical protein Droror1_Dr00023391 [Drosera rotundifolia]